MKKNNKGFSLVELIIVIAIMAVLVAVLAPQYIKYVEKSRKSTDINAADGIVSACKTVAIDPDTYDIVKANGFTVTWAANGTVSVTAGDNTDKDVNAAITAIVGSTITPKAKDFAATTFVYDTTTNKVTVDGATYLETALN